MSDGLPNTNSTSPNHFPQGLPAQQAQRQPSQQPQQVGSQPPLVGISNETWQQMQYRHQLQLQQQQQQSGGESMQGGVANLSLAQQQVCPPQLTSPFAVSVKISVTSTSFVLFGVSLGATTAVVISSMRSLLPSFNAFCTCISPIHIFF